MLAQSSILIVVVGTPMARQQVYLQEVPLELSWPGSKEISSMLDLMVLLGMAQLVATMRSI